MGFEIRYRYNEKLENGPGFNQEETLEKTAKVGDFYDDVPLDKLVSALMAQLARRDIYIVDYEVFEFKKVKLTCKETKGGLIVKNKKYSLDGNTLVSQDVDANAPIASPGTAPVQPGAHPHENIRPEFSTIDQSQGVNRRVIKEVTVDSDNAALIWKLKHSGLNFSENKKYPVFSERPGTGALSMLSVYVMKDDLNRDVTVSSEYFADARPIKLIDDSNDPKWTRPVIREAAPKLLYDGQGDLGMPDLNRIKKGGARAMQAARQQQAMMNPRQLAMQRARMQGADDTGGMPEEMLDVRSRGRRSRNDDLAGVSADMAAIVTKAEIKENARMKAPSRKGSRGKAARATKIETIETMPELAGGELLSPYEDVG